jgi:hypothetical protein
LVVDKGEVLLSYGAAEYRSALGVEYCTRIGELLTNRWSTVLPSSPVRASARRSASAPGCSSANGVK